MFELFIYLLAGLGAGLVTGFAGLSAAIVVTPLLVSLCGWGSYDAVTMALAADVLASFLSASTYRKNGNIALKKGALIALAAFLGTVAGSLCGYWFSRAQPDGLGYLSMLSTIIMGARFIFWPITGGAPAENAQAGAQRKRLLRAVALGLPIGWVCGFTGSGGGILMLAVLTMVLGCDLKTAVGTSTLIMTLVALVGAGSHLALGAHMSWQPAILVMAACAVGAVGAAKFANRCEEKKLNRIIGALLALLGAFTLAIKLW